MKKRSVAICLYVLFASVAIAIIALDSWVYGLLNQLHIRNYERSKHNNQRSKV